MVMMHRRLCQRRRPQQRRHAKEDSIIFRDIIFSLFRQCVTACEIAESALRKACSGDG